MKKNIVITILSFLLILFVLFGFIKANEAEKNFMVAETAQAEAQENAMEAMKQSEIAISRAVEAEEATVSAEQLAQQLEKCQSN